MTRIFAVVVAVAAPQLLVVACNRDALETAFDAGAADASNPDAAVTVAADLSLQVSCGPGPDPCQGDPCVEGQCARYAFVTNAIYSGNLGGLDGADAKCQAAAVAAQLPGDYKAWLSTSTVNAADRLTHHPGPYVLVNTKVLAHGWNQLALSTHLIAWNVTELGFALAQDSVWTASEADGTYASYSGDCSGWTYADTVPCGGSDLTPCTSCAGDPSQIGGHWTLQACGNGCWNNRFHLYCLQQ